MIFRDPDEARKKLFDIAAQQSGYFAAKQAVQAGYSHRLHTYHVGRGHWLKVDRGIFRLRDYPPDRYEDLVRWSFWSGHRAIVSHETAAAIHELGDLLPGYIHLTLPPGFRKRPSPGIHVNIARVPEVEVQTMNGFRVTRPLRTILDLISAGTEADRMISVVRDALERGAVRRAEMGAARAKLSGVEARYMDRILDALGSRYEV